MRFGSRHHSGLSVLGLVLVALALVSRITMFGVAMDVAEDQTAAFDAIAVLCQTGDQPAPAKHAPLHAESCLTCLLCQSAAYADVTVPAPVYVPVVVAEPAAPAFMRPAARAPPTPILAALYPTGPPART